MRLPRDIIEWCKGGIEMTHSYRIHDDLRDRTYKSIKEAWECLSPETTYAVFYYRLKNRGIKHLCMPQSETFNKEEPPCIQRKRVVDVKSGVTWHTVTECAASLGVSRKAVQSAIKRKGKCKGLMLRMVEEPKDVSGGYK